MEVRLRRRSNDRPGSAALSRSDTRREYIRATSVAVDSSGSAFGIQEAACSEEKAERDWTGRKEQVSRHLDGKGRIPRSRRLVGALGRD
ncbi:hypothetical protein WN48_09972 [Eufriesea mexicana]|uniref:Uncharacterized protein n=1 Tax=Eufriesea mexicana TaxID=516756 RepID=A0A310S6U7_9HYME|nr:hypothetical protein WN48_09972 [Eufriesea mexicana]